jgi:hypothetical protein
MDLSATHLHLLLNHVPTVGFIIGLGLFILGLIARSEHLKVASLVVLIGVALVTVPVFVTGGAAEQQLCVASNVPGPCPDAAVSRTLIEMHEGAAFIAMYIILFAGGLAWLGLWQHRRIGRIPTWNVVLLLIVSLVAVATVAQAANLGGEIRHPEIRVTQESPDPPISRVVGTFIAQTPWTFAATETLHMIGLTLLIGVVLLIDLKILGFMPSLPYATLDRLLPWGILGFGLNASTGMLFFVAAAYQYVENLAFNWKLVFLMAAGMNMLLFTFDPTWTREGQPAPAYSKAIAVTALGLWVGVMFWGTMLPFIGQAF